MARHKAAERGLAVEFHVKDAMTIGDWDRRFATVIDSGLFHVFSDEDRMRYIAGLTHITELGGTAVAIVFQRRRAWHARPSACLAERDSRCF